MTSWAGSRMSSRAVINKKPTSFQWQTSNPAFIPLLAIRYVSLCDVKEHLLAGFVMVVVSSFCSALKWMIWWNLRKRFRTQWRSWKDHHLNKSSRKRRSATCDPFDCRWTSTIFLGFTIKCFVYISSARTDLQKKRLFCLVFFLNCDLFFTTLQ